MRDRDRIEDRERLRSTRQPATVSEPPTDIRSDVAVEPALPLTDRRALWLREALSSPSLRS